MGNRQECAPTRMARNLAKTHCPQKRTEAGQAGFARPHRPSRAGPCRGAGREAPFSGIRAGRPVARGVRMPRGDAASGGRGGGCPAHQPPSPGGLPPCRPARPLPTYGRSGGSDGRAGGCLGDPPVSGTASSIGQGGSAAAAALYPSPPRQRRLRALQPPALHSGTARSLRGPPGAAPNSMLGACRASPAPLHGPPPLRAAPAMPAK